jgi:hypothetical protein
VETFLDHPFGGLAAAGNAPRDHDDAKWQDLDAVRGGPARLKA